MNGVCAKPHLVLPTPDPGLDSDGMKAGGADLWTLQGSSGTTLIFTEPFGHH